MSSDQRNDEDVEPVLKPETWVDEYGDYLFRYAYSRLRDPNAAEEVVQETFVAGVRYAEQFSGRGSERGWLLGILKRKIIDYVRLRAKHASSPSHEDESDHCPPIRCCGQLEISRDEMVVRAGPGPSDAGAVGHR